MLLIHGLSDTTVLLRNSRNLAARIRELGGEVTLIEYPKIGHAPMVGAIAVPLRWLAPTLEDVTAFVEGVR